VSCLAVEQLDRDAAQHNQRVLWRRPVHALPGHHLQGAVVGLIVGRGALPGLWQADRQAGRQRRQTVRQTDRQAGRQVREPSESNHVKCVD